MNDNGSKSVYLQKVKEQNISLLLRRMWEAEAVSRVELVEMTGLTSGTITNLTQQLIRKEVIRETVRLSDTVGRKRVMLQFHSHRYRILGLDIGRSSFEVVAADLTGRIIRSVEGSASEAHVPEETLDRVAPHLESMREDARRQGNAILGLGVSIPGPMDAERGVLLSPPNFPGWERYPVKSSLERRFGMKVWIGDDAHTSALAEKWFGVGRAVGNLVFVTMGVGIGGGIISKGELIRGTDGVYGQIGHLTMVPHGLRCACGNEGCWETVCSIPAILRRWGGGGSIGQFFRSAREGERQAAQVLEEVLYTIESAITNLYHMYDPELVVIGGKLHPHLKEYMPALRAGVASRVFASARNRVRIEACTFGNSQNAAGAAALVFGKMLSEPAAVLDMDG